MFPVTLEFKDGTVATIHPPCYGFLKKGQWDGGGDDCYPVQYDATSGWNAEYDNYGSYSYCIWTEGDNDEITLGDHYNLNDLGTIWNSGTHFPVFGLIEGELSASQFDLNATNPVCDGDSARRPLSNVEKWASQNKRPDVTIRAVMDLFEKWIDKDAESCFVWGDDDMFGVSARFPADRCLFYLMVNRSLWQHFDFNNTVMLLDAIYKDGLTPMQALIMSRLIVTKTNLLGKEEASWVGNDYDSCIIPMSLVTVGMGTKFAEPVSVFWRQDPYVSSEGHLRDDDYPCVGYDKDNMCYVNNSMFMPLFHPLISDQDENQKLIIKDECFILEFAARVAEDEKSRLLLTTSPHGFNQINLYYFTTWMGNSYIGTDKCQVKVRPQEEWAGIVKDILLQK